MTYGCKLDWDGDNSVFIVELLAPMMDLPKDVMQVLRWAYGYDGSDRSYEKESDGSSIVPDFFMLGKIKEPPGVMHDYINRVKKHITPDGHKWTAMEDNNLYYRTLVAFSYPKLVAMNRWLHVTLATPFWWK